MAIIKQPGISPLRAVVGSTMLTVGAQGSPVAMPATNNRARLTGGTSRSTKAKLGRSYPAGVADVPGFTPLDNQIRYLDAQFDNLPNQADWNAVAAAFAGLWGLCANCQPDAGGKKLYRQVQMNRSLVGLPPIGTPPTPSAGFVPGVSSAQWINQPSVPGNNNASVTLDELGTDVWVVAVIGLALANPIAFVASSESGTSFPPGTDIFKLVSQTITVKAAPAPISAGDFENQVCTFDVNGFPGLPEQADFNWVFLP
jgi:hypothetical protein